MRLLSVSCKHCGHVFGTGMRRPVYGLPAMGPNPWTCPACRTSARYGTRDFLEVPASGSA